jgi:hypothetical protein
MTRSLRHSVTILAARESPASDDARLRERRRFSRPRTLPGEGSEGSEPPAPLSADGTRPVADSVRVEALRAPRLRGEPALCALFDPMSPMSTPLRLRCRSRRSRCADEGLAAAAADSALR